MELTTRRWGDETLEANKGPAPRPPDYKREPFATHSGKVGPSNQAKLSNVESYYLCAAFYMISV